MKRASQRRRSTRTRARTRRAVLKAALRKARLLGTHFASLISADIGWKHSRTHGFKPGRPCIRLLVHRKIDDLAPGHRLPRTLEVRWRGKRYRVPTDVHALSRGILQTDAHVWNRPHRVGTPSLLVRRKGGNVDELWMLTAGHVLCAPTAFSQPDPPNVRVAPPAQAVGTADASRTYYITYAKPAPGTLVDVGVVRLDGSVPAALKGAPWKGLTGVGDLAPYFSASPHPRVLVHVQAAPPIEVDLATEYDIQFRHPDLPAVYSGVLFEYAVPKGTRRLQGGDSGSPVTSLDGKSLLGFHVIGLQLDANGGATVGIAVGAADVLAKLRALDASGIGLRLVPGAELVNLP